MRHQVQETIALSDLAFTSFIYSRISKYADSLEKLREATGPVVDLTKKSHVTAILQWLRQWKCRNLETAYESTSTKSLQSWYTQNRRTLSTRPENIVDYQGDWANTVAKVFDSLAQAWATPKKRIGPTPTSKLLYLLKPMALPPWDEPIRKAFGLNGSGSSYAVFLESCRDISKSIQGQCTQMNVTLDEITRYGRARSIGMAKAIDEYYWTRITMKLDPPTIMEFDTWIKVVNH